MIPEESQSYPVDDWPPVSQMPRNTRISPSTHVGLQTPESSDDHDTVSVRSAASALSVASPRPSNMMDLKIPDMWRPSIMLCIQQGSDEERRLKMDQSIRGEITRDLVTQMFTFQARPTTDFFDIGG